MIREFGLVALVVCLLPLASVSGAERRWSIEKADRWYRNVEPIRGFNYLPRTAVNSTEMWQEGTFDPKTIDQELGWAEKYRYNGMRVFLQYIVWKQNPEGFKKRLDEFLRIGEKHGIGALLVLFDDCAFAGKDPYLGKQDDPLPGRHNSGWVPSPGPRLVVDRAAWPDLERYVKDVVGGFRKDKRVLVWDLYNEPGVSNMREKSLPLLEAAFHWAREVKPSQPLTTGPYGDPKDKLSQRFLELSDVVSFHHYGDGKYFSDHLRTYLATKRPLFCTEWMARQTGSTFANILPIFSQHRISWYQWGLVAGRTQTYIWWGSKKGAPVPKLWQHDVLHPDGTPFDSAEMELVRHYAAQARARR